MRKQLISFVQVIKFCKISSSRGGFHPNPLRTPLHAPTPFAQIGQGYLRRDLCEGILLHLRWPWHGSVWANICSPLKATKCLQISTGLPERASKKIQLLKEPTFSVNVN